MSVAACCETKENTIREHNINNYTKICINDGKIDKDSIHSDEWGHRQHEWHDVVEAVSELEHNDHERYLRFFLEEEKIENSRNPFSYFRMGLRLQRYSHQASRTVILVTPASIEPAPTMA